MSRNPHGEFKDLFDEIVDAFGLQSNYDLESSFDSFLYTLSDAVDANESLGEIAYDAMRSHTGVTAPTWSQIDQKTKETWISIALAVKEDVS